MKYELKNLIDEKRESMLKAQKEYYLLLTIYHSLKEETIEDREKREKEFSQLMEMQNLHNVF